MTSHPQCHAVINDQCNGSQVPLLFKRRNILTLILQQIMYYYFLSENNTKIITNVFTPSFFCNTKFSSSIKNFQSQSCNEKQSGVPISIKCQNISTRIIKQISIFLSENITHSITEVLAYTMEQSAIYLQSPYDLQAYSVCIQNYLCGMISPSLPNYRAHLVCTSYACIVNSACLY